MFFLSALDGNASQNFLTKGLCDWLDFNESHSRDSRMWHQLDQDAGSRIQTAAAAAAAVLLLLLPGASSKFT